MVDNMYQMEPNRTHGSFESQFDAVFSHVKNDAISSEVDQAAQTLARLYRAYQSAIERNVDVWEFAIEISDFVDVGVSKQLMRQLSSSGWVAHRREVILPNMHSRQFQEESVHTLSKQTCFVITEVGKEKYRQMMGGGMRETASASRQQGRLRPVWDRDRRELRLGDKIVKRFRWPAEVQFAVLERFETLGWPDRISDPLPRDNNVDPKRRLHDAIKCLNQRRECELIGFHGDGTGSGIVVRIYLETNGQKTEPEFQVKNGEHVLHPNHPFGEKTDSSIS